MYRTVHPTEKGAVHRPVPARAANIEAPDEVAEIFGTWPESPRWARPLDAAPEEFEEFLSVSGRRWLLA